MRLVLFAAAATARLFTAPLYDFLTRPELRVPRLTVDAYDADRVAPGYIFMSPWSPEVGSGPDEVNYQYGAAIYDNDGELVYTAADPDRQVGAMNFVVCAYDDAPHLCISHFAAPPDHQHNDIMNGSYDVVRYAYPTGTLNGSRIQEDLHEFVVRPGADGPTALQSTHIVHEIAPFEFERCKMRIRWLKTSVLQEVTLDGENTVVFEWSCIDHLPLDGAVQCGGADGMWLDGGAPETAFDHFHMNSVDKDAAGCYYVSARARSSIYKLAPNGTVLWRLGRISNFTHLSDIDTPLEFSYQHHLRLRPEYPGYDLENGRIVLSLFDNANDRYDHVGRTSNFSSGKIILVDEHAKTATLKESWPLFHDQHELATNQGSFQLLPNGNRMLGGGNIQEVVEWQPGYPDPVFRAHFGDWENSGHKINSYRNMRFEWTGTPRWAPDVFAFAPACGGTMTVYASWNGATGVTRWRVFGSAQANGPFREIGQMPRTGFESAVQTRFANFVYVVAEGQDGQSDTVRAAVLDANTATRLVCGPTRCEPGFNYTRATRACPPVDLATEPEPEVILSDQTQARYNHCDPCLGPFE